MSASPGFADAPASQTVCRLAAEEVIDLLRRAGRQGPPVEALEPNDQRLAEAATLVVLLHTHAQIVEADRTLAVSVSLHRSRPELGAPPFFLAPPEGLVVRGALEESVLRSRLRRLLEVSVARPLLYNR